MLCYAYEVFPNIRAIIGYFRMEELNELEFRTESFEKLRVTIFWTPFFYCSNKPNRLLSYLLLFTKEASLLIYNKFKL